MITAANNFWLKIFLKPVRGMSGFGNGYGVQTRARLGVLGLHRPGIGWANVVYGTC